MSQELLYLVRDDFMTVQREECLLGSSGKGKDKAASFLPEGTF